MPPKKQDKKSQQKRKAKVIQKVPRFTKEELNEEVDTFLTCYNPYMSQNCVQFDQKTKTYKPIFDYRKPVVVYRNIGSIKRRLVGRYGVVYEEVAVKDEEVMRNKFNFRNAASQTYFTNPEDKNEYIDPNLYPVLTFGGQASKAEILAAYLEFEKQKKEKEQETQEKGSEQEQDAKVKSESETKMEKAGAGEKSRDQFAKELLKDLPSLLKRIGRRNLTFKDSNCKYLRLFERMVDQNMMEANLDFNYYDNPNDEFQPNTGSLLPLWQVTCRRARGIYVTGVSWNTGYGDLFAVGYRTWKEAEDEEVNDEDDLGFVREEGLVCVYSLKGPSHPERIIICPSGVSCLEFHPDHPHLLLIAFACGSLAVYDLRSKDCTPKAQDSKFLKYYHQESTSKVQWLMDQIPQKFCSISFDGKIINWKFLLNDLFPTEVVTSLRIKNWPIEPPPKGLDMKLEPEEKTGENADLNTCGTAISVNRHDPELFLVSTETGLVHLGSFDDQVCSHSYEDHKDSVRNVRWNLLHPTVFLTCGRDFTVQIWDHSIKNSIFEFFFVNEVIDLAWAPFSSTLFALITGNALVLVFDLAINKVEPVGTYTVYTPKQNIGLTKIIFHPWRPILLVGDDKGKVVILKLSPNLRSSMKAMETLDRSKFITGEIEKMNKLLSSATTRKSSVS